MKTRTRGPSGKSRGIVKRKFTPSEDIKLHQLVARNGTSNWKAIARSMPNRTSRQCRERWKYYLANEASSAVTWTPEEDRLLIEKVAEFGPRWAALVLYFTNKTDINLKNRFHKLQRSHFRELQTSPTLSQAPTESSDNEEKSPRWLVQFPAPIHTLLLAA